MAAKTGTWLIAIGSFLAFVGLCFMPAAFGPEPDQTVLGAAAVIFSAGLLLIAGGLYVKARALGGPAPAGSPAGGKRTRRANCPTPSKRRPAP